MIRQPLRGAALHEVNPGSHAAVLIVPVESVMNTSSPLRLRDTPMHGRPRHHAGVSDLP